MEARPKIFDLNDVLTCIRGYAVVKITSHLLSNGSTDSGTANALVNTGIYLMENVMKTSDTSHPLDFKAKGRSVNFLMEDIWSTNLVIERSSTHSTHNNGFVKDSQLLRTRNDDVYVVLHDLVGESRMYAMPRVHGQSTDATSQGVPTRFGVDGHPADLKKAIGRAE